MQQEQGWEAVPFRRPESIRSLHEIFFTLSTVSAAGFALLFYVFHNATSMYPASDVGYYFRRAAVRINDFLHIRAISPITTDALGRRYPSPWSQIGEELAILISAFAAAIILLFLLRLAAGTRVHRFLLHRVSGLAALFAAPLAYLWALQASWQLKSAVEPEGPPSYPFWQSPLVAFVAAEILCLGVLLLVSRHRSLSRRMLAVFVVIHYAFWVSALWISIPLWIHNLLTRHLLVIVFAASGISLLHLKAQFNSLEVNNPRRAGKWMVGGAVVSLALLLLIWVPARTYSFAQPEDINSVTIEIWRGPCFGPCPSYSVAIHGNGLVEYAGNKYVRVHERQTATISREQVTQLLQKLDRVQFFTIEDRAFHWCFDTPSVAISVSIDGRTKRVASDAGCVGAESGLQARFVKVADEIDDLIGSDRWVKCDGRCRN